MQMLLYGAFALVALWLLGEVLAQRMAPFGWRVLAFVGFLVLVIGVHAAQVALIAAGAVAFAVGQMAVTMAVRRGEETSWGLPLPAFLRAGRGGGDEPERVGEIILDDPSEDEPMDEREEFEPFAGVPRQREEGDPGEVGVDDDTSRFAAVPADAAGYGDAGYQQQGDFSESGWSDGDRAGAGGYAEYPQQPVDGYSSGEFVAVPGQEQPGYAGYGQGGYDAGGYPAEGAGWQGEAGYGAEYGGQAAGWQQPASSYEQGYQNGQYDVGGYGGAAQDGYQAPGYDAGDYGTGGYDDGGWNGYPSGEQQAYQGGEAPAGGPADWQDEQQPPPRHHGRHRS